MKKIPLTQGKFALVDDEDFQNFSKYKWHCNNGYAKRMFSIGQFNGKSKLKAIYLHREIIGNNTKFGTDHIDGNRLNNQKNNLRICSQKKNAMNRTKQTASSSSQYKGVYWCKIVEKWRANIGFKRKKIHLGNFDCEMEAAKKYNEYAKKIFGKFAKLNVIS
mgnify:CR=1 FL=1